MDLMMIHRRTQQEVPAMTTHQHRQALNAPGSHVVNISVRSN
jgi:hypothetical protein